MILNQRNGFSLLEVMITLMVLTFLALSIILGALSIRRSSEHTIRSNLADAVSIGFLEQLRSIDFTILQLQANTDGPVTLMVDDALPITVNLNRGDYTQISVPLDARADGTTSRTMNYEFRPRVIPDPNLPLLTMIIEYRWETPQMPQSNPREMILSRAAAVN